VKLKILALSQDISLLNIVDYILYKDYKIVKSTSFENLDVEFNSFDLIIIDLPYWENNSNINRVLQGHNNIPLIILTEDKSSDLISSLKNNFHVKSVLKEPLSKKELKESVKELIKKKKSKKERDKDYDKWEEKNEPRIASPIEEIAAGSDTIFFRLTDLQDKRIEYISDNYKNVLGINGNIAYLKDLTGEHEIPFISPASPTYSVVYKINSDSGFKIVKETGRGIFDANKYLKNIEGTIIDYSKDYLKEKLLEFTSLLLKEAGNKSEPSEFINKVVYLFSEKFSEKEIQLSIIFLGKDYFVKDFITTDFSVSSDITSAEKKLGEVILFSLDSSSDLILKSFTDILSNIIVTYYLHHGIEEKYNSETSRLSQELNLITGRLAQAESAFHDKARSYDNLNELFSSAMKDFKTISSKLNRSVIILETNADGKFLSANENYYRAVASDRAAFVGKYFDDIFENSNWQNFQFEFFNNANQELTLRQKNKEGKSFYLSFHIAREESDNGYKFVFYGKDKTEAKTLELELNKQVTEYNAKVTELIDARKANELLWEEMNTLKEELKGKDELIKKQEKKLLKAEEKEAKAVEFVPPASETKEYNLDKNEAESIFREDIEQKIEETKNVIEEEKDENETIFKNLRGIDFKIGLANAYDNIDTYNEILVNFENDYIGFMNDIKGMYLVNDNEYIKSRLLTLAEESKYMGAEDLEKSAQLFHDKLADNKINNFDFELSVLGVHLNFTLESIRKYKDEYSLLEPKQTYSAADTEVREEINAEYKVEAVPENTKDDILSPEVFDVINSGDNIIEEEPKLSISLAPAKKDEPQTIPNETVSEDIIEENKTIEDVTEEIYSNHTITEADKEVEKPDNTFTILVKDLKSSVENSEDISVLKEKLFKLKFENNDFSKIEKIEALELSIEQGNNSQSISLLDELKS